MRLACWSTVLLSTMPAEKRQINLTLIHFPSDDLSFGHLRRQFPEIFDSGPCVTFFHLPDNNPEFHGQNLTNLLDGEREVATRAFCTALGQSWRQRSGFSAAEVKDFVTADYIRYGIATGPKHAKQLIRAIETQATEQARGESRDR